MKIVKWISITLISAAGLLLLIIALFFLFEYESWESIQINHPKESKPRYYSSSDSYEAPKELEQLPLNIQDSAMSHLKSWVGLALIKELNYTGGQIINPPVLRNLDRMETNDKENITYTNIPPTYNLYFTFECVEKGIREYTATVSMDKYGSLMDCIRLPKKSRESKEYCEIRTERCLCKSSKSSTFR